jgi:Concanavalin A-like lectin/glucanases superfamily
VLNVRNKGPRAFDSESRLIWDSLDVAADDEPRVESAEGRRRAVMRPRTLLIGSTTLVLVAGAAYGAETLSTQSGPAAAGGAAAILQPSSPVSAQAEAVTSPSASPSPTGKPTPRKSSTTPSHVVTSVVTVGAAIPNAPASKSSGVSAVVPPPVGNWLLNQTVGNTAVDSTGTHDGTASDGWWAGGACLFNGTNSQIYTDGAVLSTGAGASFTVSAWVDMTALPASSSTDEAAVSQDASVNSAFYLEFSGSAGRWSFARLPADSNNSSTSEHALSKSGPSLNTWTHLVGVYDAATGAEQLYVNGVLQGTATDSTPFSSSGDLLIGRAQYHGSDTDWFQGAIKKVEVFDVALNAAQVGALS